MKCIIDFCWYGSYNMDGHYIQRQKRKYKRERKITMLKRIDLIQWNCDKCYSDMEVTQVGMNRYLVHCPDCGTEWYVDEDGELLD